MADVFISYKREDRGAVERLVRLLEAEQITAWWDPSIVPGERYAAVIHRALDDASCVVVAWSRRSVESLWVQDEAGIGRDRGVLVPVSLDGVEPPLGFRQLQTLNLADWNGRSDDPRILHFLAGVRRLVCRPATTEAAAAALPNRGDAKLRYAEADTARAPTIDKRRARAGMVFWSRRNALLAAGSVAALLLAVGAFLLFSRPRETQNLTFYPPGLPVPVERSFTDCGAGCPVMIVVPTGTFQMGSPEREPQRGSDEGPQHEVTFSKPLAIAKFPVTVEDWEFCVSQHGCTDWPPALVAKWGRGRQPVINVSWDDAKAYATWLSRYTGKLYRLMSEAEREYITRAGTTTPFWWGSSISSEQANYDGTQRYVDEPTGRFRQNTLPVDSFQPNPWGFYDVSGNTWDWVEDCYHDSYDGAPPDGSAWTSGDCNRRVLRGGSWGSQPRNLRSAARYRLSPVVRGDWYGFRVARTCERVCVER